MPPRKTRTFNQWQSMQKAKSNGKGEKKFFFPACQLERARVLGFLAKHLAAIKGNKGSEGRLLRFLPDDVERIIQPRLPGQSCRIPDLVAHEITPTWQS